MCSIKVKECLASEKNKNNNKKSAAGRYHGAPQIFLKFNAVIHLQFGLMGPGTRWFSYELIMARHKYF